jgi:hypothetical protein
MPVLLETICIPSNSTFGELLTSLRRTKSPRYFIFSKMATATNIERLVTILKLPEDNRLQNCTDNRSDLRPELNHTLRHAIYLPSPERTFNPMIFVDSNSTIAGDTLTQWENILLPQTLCTFVPQEEFGWLAEKASRSIGGR